MSRFDKPFDQFRVPSEVEGLKATSLPTGSAERVPVRAGRVNPPFRRSILRAAAGQITICSSAWGKRGRRAGS